MLAGKESGEERKRERKKHRDRFFFLAKGFSSFRFASPFSFFTFQPDILRRVVARKRERGALYACVDCLKAAWRALERDRERERKRNSCRRERGR